MATSSIPTTISTQFNLSTAGTTYVLTGNTVVTNVVAPFNVTAGGIIFEGNGFTITVNNTPNFEGLFNASLTVRNVSHAITGTTGLKSGGGSPQYATPGWFFKSQVASAVARNCINYANIDQQYTSGFFGANCSGCVASNCINYGNIPVDGGGIFGAYSQFITVINCQNHSATRGRRSGGIFGYSVADATAYNCISTTPSIAPDSGGGAIFSERVNRCSAINCTSSEGPYIGAYGGGIFGFRPIDSLASNCINRTTISGTLANFAYGIFGGPYSGLDGGVTATNCYNVGVITIGGAIGGSTAINCYTNNGTFADTTTVTDCRSNSGTWNDATASSALTGDPTTYPGLGTVWASTAANTPYVLLMSVSIAVPNLVIDGSAYSLTSNSIVSNNISPLTSATPIVFDGGGYTITISGVPSFAGLFGTNTTVRNLSLQIAGNSTLFGFNNNPVEIGPSWFFTNNTSGGTASNCTNYGDVRNVSYATLQAINDGGGFFGSKCSNCTALNCTNSGAIIGSRPGGIFGAFSSNCTASNCLNNGGKSQCFEGGGIFGRTATNCTAVNCVANSPNAPGNSDSNAGIFGPASSLCTASGCTNNDSTIGNQAGGIFGTVSNCIAINCINNAPIQSPTPNTGVPGGGIFATQSSDCSATSCTNNGSIIDTNGGGIFGKDVLRCTATNCTNNGNMTPQDHAGGIFGRSATDCSAIQCTNTGAKVIPCYAAGGIFASSALRCRASNCISVGRREAGGGAIFGQSVVNCTAINSTCSEGDFIVEYSGGLFSTGATDCSAFSCINRTPISVTTGQGNTAGIFGEGGARNYASNCYNTGTITNPTYNFGIISYVGDIGTGGPNGTAVNCYTTNGAIGPPGGTYTSCSSNNGFWNDISASATRNGNNGLVGTPFPDATTNPFFPAVASVWYSTGQNTPFLQSDTIPPCFVAGTRILTPEGYRLVETLCDGDSVQTSDGRSVLIKVFKNAIECADKDTAPYVVSKDIIAPGVPDEDLHVSGHHMIQDSKGVWQAPSLVSSVDGKVRQYGVGSPITYYHIECPDYYTDNLIANNCIAESFRNLQGTCEVSYKYDTAVGGFFRVMGDEIDPRVLETGFADKHVLNDTACC